MADSTPTNQSPVEAAFIEHVRAFHESLPHEEQQLLRQVFALAQRASDDDSDVQGFVDIQTTLKGLLVATTLMFSGLVAHPLVVSADAPPGATTVFTSPSRTATSSEQPTISSYGGAAPGASTVLRQTDALAALLRHDLAIVKIDGPSSIGVGNDARYAATIRNDGALADGNVEVTIGFAGVLQPESGIVQGIGLSCGPGVVPATLMCRGGTLAPGQETTLAFSTHAANAGQGTITVSVRMSGNVTESELDNNQASFSVTVTP